MIKKVLIALLVVVMATGTGVAYAWWDSLTVNNSESNIVTIGAGVDLAVASYTIQPASDGNLVPASAEVKAGDTTEILVDYSVSLDYAVVTPFDLAVTVSNVLIDGVADTNVYVITAVSGVTTVNNVAGTVTISITLDDSPADGAAAKATLENAQISFDVEFVATAA
jgi:uncharacterized cupredoxin-like copper-binding protein